MTVIIRKNAKNTHSETFSEVDFIPNPFSRRFKIFLTFIFRPRYVSTASTKLSSILLPTRTIGNVISVINKPIAAG